MKQFLLIAMFSLVALQFCTRDSDVNLSANAGLLALVAIVALAVYATVKELKQEKQ